MERTNRIKYKYTLADGDDYCDCGYKKEKGKIINGYKNCNCITFLSILLALLFLRHGSRRKKLTGFCLHHKIGKEVLLKQTEPFEKLR